MTLSTTTIIVLAANGLTSVLAAALLMLVLWQAPRRRSNQLFALVMLTLGAYSAINAFGRFVGELNIDPAQVFYLATSFYGLFVVAIFFFGSEFAGSRTPSVRAMRMIGVALGVVLIVALWGGSITRNIRPVDSHDGGYQWEFTPFGLLASLFVLAYLVTTAVVLHNMTNDRGRSLWLAPLLVIGNAVSSSLIWPLVPIPLGALFLAGAALVLGRQVLRYELFNPLAELNQQLARKNTELLEASAMKSQFLANMSHELRTPLNSIIGYTELVTNGTYGALNDTQRDRLEKVIRNGHTLLNLINDVLDLNKIETGRVVLERRSVPTAGLLESVLAVIEPLATKKGLAIRRGFESAPAIYGDETRLRQIITNIAANAVKFTHEGEVRVSAFRVGDRVQIEIADTGIGIPADQLDAVFIEFQQLDNSSTRRYEGTGLGMAITKKLVELHGGRIWLESTLGQGTTFYVTLPAADPVRPAAGPIPTPAADSRAPTVLLIDDSAEALELLADLLGKAGYRVVTAQSGPEGLTRARQLQPDLITLDVIMPGMDGWQVLRALKEESTTRAIPVVIASIIENRPLAIALGASEALVKPLEQATLLVVLEQTLAGSQQDRPILVVDDRQEDCDLIVETLRSRGYPVKCVGGGQLALDWLEQNLPILVVLDLLMPEVSGFDVLAYLRHEERLAQVPVIVLTAQALGPEELQLLERRCAELVQKGYAGPEVLLRAVQRALAAEPLPAG